MLALNLTSSIWRGGRTGRGKLSKCWSRHLKRESLNKKRKCAMIEFTWGRAASPGKRLPTSFVTLGTTFWSFLVIFFMVHSKFECNIHSSFSLLWHGFIKGPHSHWIDCNLIFCVLKNLCVFHLSKTPIVVVKVGEELVWPTWALNVKLGTASGARFVCMACMFAISIKIYSPDILTYL